MKTIKIINVFFQLLGGGGPSAGTGGLLCEPAVVVRRSGRPPCVWNLAKLDNRIVEMRELYSEWKVNNNSKESKSNRNGKDKVSLYESYNPIRSKQL